MFLCSLSPVCHFEFSCFDSEIEESTLKSSYYSCGNRMLPVTLQDSTVLVPPRTRTYIQRVRVIHFPLLFDYCSSPKSPLFHFIKKLIIPAFPTFFNFLYPRWYFRLLIHFTKRKIHEDDDDVVTVSREWLYRTVPSTTCKEPII